MKRMLINRYRIVIANGIYHITQRAPGIERLFVEANDYSFFIHCLKEISTTYKISVFCFAQLSNHLHLLLKIEEPNLSVAMKMLFARYAMYFNIKYKRKGHVFCGRYRCALCNDETYLLAASIYIHLNPSKAGLCDYPSEYRWSSIRLFIDNNANDSFIDYKYILRLLDNDIDNAKIIYRDLLEKASMLHYESLFMNKSAVIKFEMSAVTHIPLLKKISTVKCHNSITNLSDSIETVRRKKYSKKPRDSEAKRYLIKQLISRGYSKEEIADCMGISRQNVYYNLNKRRCYKTVRTENVTS